MPGADRRSEPRRDPTFGGWGSLFAALIALGLGVLGAVMMVVGHHPWDGPEIKGLTQTHGIHQGDALALIPLLTGIGLAVWCATRPSWKQTRRLLQEASEQLAAADGGPPRSRHRPPT